MEAVILAISPFVLNFVMGLFKYLGAEDLSTYGKRFMLAVFSLMGVLAMSLLTGTQPDLNTMSGLVQTALTALLMFVASHGSYVLFWKRSN